MAKAYGRLLGRNTGEKKLPETMLPTIFLLMEVFLFHVFSDEKSIDTSGKRGFYPPPLVPKLIGPGLKGALVPVRAPGARPAPSPGS
jgi:hypothetical protein